MSMPSYPAMNPPIKLEDALSMIVASIAMEELGFSHIINAESEKLKYVLENIDGCNKASVSEVLAVNKSIKSLLDSIMQNQILLKNKMQCALDAMDCHPTGTVGPTGPTGPTGPPGHGGRCCAISFTGCPEQCWEAGEPLIWRPSERHTCGTFYLDCSREKIILDNNKYYTANFSLNLQGEKRHYKNAVIALQLKDCGKNCDVFVCYAPIVYSDVTFTASASGIFISTRGCIGRPELALRLISPELVRLKQASIYLSEI